MEWNEMKLNGTRREEKPKEDIETIWDTLPISRSNTSFNFQLPTSRLAQTTSSFRFRVTR